MHRLNEHLHCIPLLERRELLLDARRDLFFRQLTSRVRDLTATRLGCKFATGETKDPKRFATLSTKAGKTAKAERKKIRMNMAETKRCFKIQLTNSPNSSDLSIVPHQRTCLPCLYLDENRNCQGERFNRVSRRTCPTQPCHLASAQFRDLERPNGPDVFSMRLIDVDSAWLILGDKCGDTISSCGLGYLKIKWSDISAKFNWDQSRASGCCGTCPRTWPPWAIHRSQSPVSHQGSIRSEMDSLTVKNVQDYRQTTSCPMFLLCKLLVVWFFLVELSFAQTRLLPVEAPERPDPAFCLLPSLLCKVCIQAMQPSLAASRKFRAFVVVAVAPQIFALAMQHAIGHFSNIGWAIWIVNGGLPQKISAHIAVGI